MPVPRPGPDEVLVHVLYSGVCHTDLHAMLGDWPVAPRLPLIGGHEGAGVVVARGALVGEVAVGDRVGVQFINGTCLECAFCHCAAEPLCRGARLSGYTVAGTFQQYAVARAAHLARIPAGCALDAVAPILCAGVTVWRGLKESGARPGQAVAVVGAAGGLGTLAIQYARAMGLDVVAVDVGPDKEAACRALGAAAFVDFAAVLLVAAREEPFRHAVHYVRPQGTVVCIGLPPGATLHLPVFDTVLRMVSVKGSYVGNRADTAEALDLFRKGLIKAPFKTVGLSKLCDVYRMMQDGNLTGRYVLDTAN